MLKYNRMPNSKKDNIAVIADTSAIRGNFSYPIGVELKNFVSEIRKYKTVNVKIFAPDIVIKEYVSFFVKEVENLVNQNDALKRFVGIGSKRPRSLSEDIVRKRARNILKRAGVSMLKTPSSKIDLDNLIERAVRHEPPFRRESGFRDTLIAESIMLNLESILDKNTKVYIVCEDGGLRGYLTSMFKKKKTVKTYKSFSDLSSALKMKLSKIDDELIPEITNEASRTFFDRSTSQDSLLVKFNILDKIESRFSKEFAKYHLNTSVGAFNVEERSMFLHKKKDNIYTWRNTISYGEIIQDWLTVSASPPIIERNIEFHVFWRAKVKISKKKATLSKFKFVDIKLGKIETRGITRVRGGINLFTGSPSDPGTITASGVSFPSGIAYEPLRVGQPPGLQINADQLDEPPSWE